MTEQNTNAPAPAQGGLPTGAKPQTPDQVSQYISAVTQRLAELKSDLTASDELLNETTANAQKKADEAKTAALKAVRDVQRRTDAEYTSTTQKLSDEVNKAADERDAAAQRYHDAIEEISGANIVTKGLLSNLGYSSSRGKVVRKRLVSHVKMSDLG